jgi:hypothetical protein
VVTLRAQPPGCPRPGGGSGRRLALRDRPFLAFAALNGVLTSTFTS